MLLNDQVATQDAIQERRRAKAMKLLDAKIAELSKESEGWEDVSTRTCICIFYLLVISMM